MISKIVSRYALSGSWDSRLLEQAEKALNKAIGSGAKNAENFTGLGSMPTKQDLIPKIVARGSRKVTFGFDGFPDVVRDISSKLETKLTKYFKIIPNNSKMSKPLSFEMEGTPYEMIVDKKSKDGLIRASIKQYDSVKGVLKNGHPTTVLDAQFDENGKMLSGTLRIGDNRYSETYIFTRNGKNVRRIDFEKMYKGHPHDRITYIPSAGTDRWAPLKDSKSNRLGCEISGLTTEAVIGEPLGCLFLKLAGLKNTLPIV